MHSFNAIRPCGRPFHPRVDTKSARGVSSLSSLSNHSNSVKKPRTKKAPIEMAKPAVACPEVAAAPAQPKVTAGVPTVLPACVVEGCGGNGVLPQASSSCELCCSRCGRRWQSLWWATYLRGEPPPGNGDDDEEALGGLQEAESHPRPRSNGGPSAAEEDAGCKEASSREDRLRCSEQSFGSTLETPEHESHCTSDPAATMQTTELVVVGAPGEAERPSGVGTQLPIGPSALRYCIAGGAAVAPLTSFPKLYRIVQTNRQPASQQNGCDRGHAES